MRSPRRILLALAALALVRLTTACGGSLPGKVQFAGPSSSVLPGGVNVVLQFAHAEDDEFLVHLHVNNLTDHVMRVDRDLIGLRLPDGRVLPRDGMNHSPYEIEPGQGHDVWVAFHQNGMDMRKLQCATVIIGGISYADDPTPRTVGEIPLAFNGEAND